MSGYVFTPFCMLQEEKSAWKERKIVATGITQISINQTESEWFK